MLHERLFLFLCKLRTSVDLFKVLARVSVWVGMVTSVLEQSYNGKHNCCGLAGLEMFSCVKYHKTLCPQHKSAHACRNMHRKQISNFCLARNVCLQPEDHKVTQSCLIALRPPR